MYIFELLTSVLTSRERKTKRKKKSFKLRRGNERGFYTGIQGLDAKRSRLIFWRETDFAGVVKIDPVGLPKVGRRATPSWSCPPNSPIECF